MFVGFLLMWAFVAGVAGSSYQCDRPGYSPYPGNCGLFHICDGRTWFVGRCPRGQWWHAHFETCARPSSFSPIDRSRCHHQNMMSTTKPSTTYPPVTPPPVVYRYATCQMRPNPVLAMPSTVRGSVEFRQRLKGGQTDIRVRLSGFNATDNVTSHGFTIYQYGDLSNGCESAGGHYNPAGVPHGGPTEIVRHAGDLGNIREDTDGTVNSILRDNLVSLHGKYSVIGRALVVHALADDRGREVNLDSKIHGNAGPRLACCVIGRAGPGRSFN